MHPQPPGPRRQNDRLPRGEGKSLVPWPGVIGPEEGLEAECHRVVRVEDVEQPSTSFFGIFFGECGRTARTGETDRGLGYTLPPASKQEGAKEGEIARVLVVRE